MQEKQNTRQRRKKNIALLAVFLFMRTLQTKQAEPNSDISKNAPDGLDFAIMPD